MAKSITSTKVKKQSVKTRIPKSNIRVSSHSRTIKISVTLPQDILKHIDKQGSNRSKTLSTILDDYLKNKQKVELNKAYKEYSKTYSEDTDMQEWEQSSTKDIGKDL